MKVKYNYNNKKKSKKTKRLIFVTIVIIIILLSIVQVTKLQSSKEDLENKTYFESSDFKTAKEILEYYGNEYISERNLKDDKYTKVIYAKFKYNLYEENESKEEFFYKIINLIAKVSEYKNFKIIDETKNITIKVTCKDNKVSIININGDSNYFETMNAKMALENQKNKQYTNLNIQSNILTELLRNNWVSKSVNFGSKESIYDKYDIYFDEGIEVKTISGKVFNIIFTSKYKDKIVNDITVNSTEDEIKSTLGNPTFENEATGGFGYKGEDIYIFFFNGEVSIYRVESDLDTNEFIELIKKYNEDKDAMELGNNLTYLWNDYDEYNYDTGYVELKYSLKGIKMQFNVGEKNGFILYSNYTGNVNEEKNISEIDSKNELLKNMHIEDTDLVFETECERMMNEYFKYTKEGDFSEEQLAEFNRPFQMMSILNIEGTYSKVKFISINKEYADSELDENLTINEYLWANDYTFIYSIKNKGIYAYDCRERKNTSLITGSDEFKLVNIENNFINYDDKQIELKLQ